jgi:O-glycosyl hydrolase
VLRGVVFDTSADRMALEKSDILSFHAYLSTARVVPLIEDLSKQQRPVFCTEWMARAVGSNIREQLHLFKSNNVGCFQWGLVRGRTQTWLTWPADLVSAHGGDASKDVWFHDQLHETGVPYDEREITILRETAEGIAAT